MKLIVLAAAAGVCSIPGAARAQHSCLDTISAASLTRVVVHLEAQASDSIGRAMLPPMDLLAQSVAERMRILLGYSAGAVGSVEPALDWRSTSDRIRVTIHHDGLFTWPDPAAESNADSTRGYAGQRLLSKALAAARDSGERVYWPDALHADSAQVTLAFVHANVSEDRTVAPVQARLAFPVFTAGVSWTRDVRVLREPHVHYPTTSQQDNAEGSLVMQFVVDSTGQVDETTIHDVWPTGLPRLRSDLRPYCDAFLQSVRRGIVDARFEPARVGGCPIRQLAQMPFEFHLRR